MDIDEILSRAETQATNEESSSHDDLLSQFKVASFALDEDEIEGGVAPLATPTEGKPLIFSPGGSKRPSKAVRPERSWDDIIPEAMKAKIEEEDKMKEQLQLYLPPRQRKVKVSGLCGRSVFVWRSKYSRITLCGEMSSLNRAGGGQSGSVHSTVVMP